MVHKHHHARHKLDFYEYIYVYRKNLQANFTLLSMRDPTKKLSVTKLYLLHIQSVFVTGRLLLRIRIAPIPNPKIYGNKYGFSIRSVFTPMVT
jgi:hypothetical protein